MLNIRKSISLLIVSSIVLLVIQSCQKVQSVPTINIVSEQKIGWKEKSPCLVSMRVDGDSITQSGKLKFRGGMSRKYFKHSISLELSQPIFIEGLPKDDDWILNANYIDKTFIRHTLSYDLFREMNDLNIAPKSRYTHLNLNGKYEGLYILMEEINAGMLKMNKQDSLAILLKDPSVFHASKQGLKLDSNNLYQQKFPKNISPNHSQFVSEMVGFLNTSSDSQFAQEIHNWIDINSVIDWHLLLLLSNNGDGVIKNFFLYKLNTETPFRIAIWDYDHSFGRDGDGELNMMKTTLDINSSILFKRLLENPDSFYRDQLKARWLALRSNGTFTANHINSKIEKYTSVLQPELKANFERWPVNGKWYYDDYSFDQEVKVMKDFIALRLPQLDQYFNELK